ncbi:MAG: KUP/HAK/KT family potassium transporter, partial [Proteobacteria bacterium]|nr:KUP/HAK/KT family potassium transporter [Pseudomonadota bacterium]
RVAWFSVVLPCLLLNYFGQGVYVIDHPNAIANPFFLIAPSWFSLPLLIIATVATIIASQAVIAAAFSLSKQGILLNLFPRLEVIRTSQVPGQVYVPRVNLMLAAGSLFLVIFFKTSSALAGAYGLAVNLVMIIVEVLIMLVARCYWQWSISKIFAIFSLFFLIDLIFLASNLNKFLYGGWIPLMVAIIVFIVMMTWNMGMNKLRTCYFMNRANLKQTLTKFNHTKLHYLPNFVAVFITDPYDQSGGNFLNFLKEMEILPEIGLVVSVVVTDYPRVDKNDRYKLEKISLQIYSLEISLGFMQEMDIPQFLKSAKICGVLPFNLNLEQVLYLVENIEIKVSKKKTGLLTWQKSLFKFLMHNAVTDFKFFKLPYRRTITIGSVWSL